MGESLVSAMTEPLGEEPTSEDRRVATWPHLCGVAVPVVVAAIIRYTVGRRRRFIGDNATEALNFQIVAWGLIALLLAASVIGSWRFAAAIVVYVVTVALSIRAAIVTRSGGRWKYPLSVAVVNTPAQ